MERQSCHDPSPKLHERRIAHVTRISTAIRSINVDPTREFSGEFLQQLVDERKDRIRIKEVHEHLDLVLQNEAKTTELLRMTVSEGEDAHEVTGIPEDKFLPIKVIDNERRPRMIFVRPYRNSVPKRHRHHNEAHCR